ncbi:MAG: hypothetical protein OHK0039_03030 [Bacteroidia bacterium]
MSLEEFNHASPEYDSFPGQFANGYEQSQTNGNSLIYAIEHDPVFNGLRRQHAQLRSANRRLGDIVAQYEAAERALATLLPALEVQILGWTREIENLNAAQQDTEQTYASIVGRLEAQIQQLKAEFRAREAQIQEAYEARIAQLRQRIDALEQQQAPQQDSGDADSPFSSLNIFGC